MMRSMLAAIVGLTLFDLAAQPCWAGPPRTSFGFSFNVGPSVGYYHRPYYPRYYHYPRSYSSFGIYVAPRPVYVAPRYVEPVYVVPAPGVIYEEAPAYDYPPPVAVPTTPPATAPRSTYRPPAPQPQPQVVPSTPNSRVPPPPPAPVSPEY
jgi:hypothetical protein